MNTKNSINKFFHENNTSKKSLLKTFVKSQIKKIAVLGFEYVKSRPNLSRKFIQLARKAGMTRFIYRLHDRIHIYSFNENQPLCQKVTSSYQVWSSHFDTPSAEIISRIETSLNPDSTVFVIARIEKSSEQYAEELAIRLVESIGQQWRAIFLFDPDCNTDANVSNIRRITNNDKRIFFDSCKIDESAEFILFIQGGALPRSHALRIFADALRNEPNALIAYSDEDQINQDKSIGNPWFKPQFSALLIGQNALLGRMIAFRPNEHLSKIIDKMVSTDENPAVLLRDYALEVGEPNILHIPHVLYHDALTTQLLPINLTLSGNFPMVSIIIPTKDRWDLLGPCIESIQGTDWPAERMEIIVVDNGSRDALTLKMLDDAARSNLIRIIHDDLPFNWSRLNNLAVRKSRSDLYVFLNNDTEAIDKCWLIKLATHALQPGSGAVGCKLLYPDGTVQHGGVIAGIQGIVAHAHLYAKANDGGYRGMANITHEVAAVTGACLAVTRENFNSVGGFNEDFPVAFNDIMFCFDLHVTGKRNLFVADALFIHHESKSRGYEDSPEKLARFRIDGRKLWNLHPGLMRHDPFYSPNLSLARPFELSFAPRRRPFWDDYCSRPRRVMILSSTYSIWAGVSEVVAQQAKALLQHGYEVIVAGPKNINDLQYPNCERLEVHDSLSAAALAVSKIVDLVIAHTNPFYVVAQWTGDHPPVVAYDYGEPKLELYGDAERQPSILAEKTQALMMASAVFSISDAVAVENHAPEFSLPSLANSQFTQWNDASNTRRQQLRRLRGWDDQFIVLNVSNFHESEQQHNGIDTYLSVRTALQKLHPELFKRTIFVLCGKATEKDVKEMSKCGLTVAANARSDEIDDLYCAADAYANFSKLADYNRGIGQALAMGLPVIASNIPAHRFYGVETTDHVSEAASWMLKTSASHENRVARVGIWDKPLSKLINTAGSICATQDNGLQHTHPTN